MLAPGAQVAGYRIAGLLGQGGMGFVYEAEHAVLGRKAALKTLLPELVDDADFRTRFIAESQTVAALDHPSIIPIYDAGEADGVVYIAMRQNRTATRRISLRSCPRRKKWSIECWSWLKSARRTSFMISDRETEES